MHIVIVGCGYLGLRAAKAWLAEGHSVTAMTRDPQRHPDWKQLGLRMIAGDVLDPASLCNLPKADLCLYAVGYDRNSIADKRTVYVDGLRHVLSEIQPRIPRLIFISSTSVYGQQAGEIVDEASECAPQNEAGQICRDAEQIVRKIYPQQDSQTPAMILRLAGIYGPGRLIARIEQLQRGTPLTGNPDAWLNLIHVDDAVQAVTRLVRSPFPAPLYLLSDAMPLVRRDFYNAVARAIGAPSPVFDPSGDIALNKRCDSRRIRRELDLMLKYPDAISALPKVLSHQAGS